MSAFDRLYKYLETATIKDHYKLEKIDNNTHQILKNKGKNKGQHVGIIHKTATGKHAVWLPKHAAHKTRHTSPEDAIKHINKTHIHLRKRVRK